MRCSFCFNYKYTIHALMLSHWMGKNQLFAYACPTQSHWTGHKCISPPSTLFPLLSTAVKNRPTVCDSFFLFCNRFCIAIIVLDYPTAFPQHCSILFNVAFSEKNSYGKIFIDVIWMTLYFNRVCNYIKTIVSLMALWT